MSKRKVSIHDDLKLRGQYLFSSIYQNKQGNIIKEIEANPKLQWNYDYEISQQMTASSDDLRVGLPIVAYKYITKDLKQYLRITYDCDVSCIPLFEMNLSNTAKIEISQQILAICVFIEKTKITHRNIKPSNIFFYDNQIFLSDFGSSRTFFQNFQKQHTSEEGKKWRNNFLYYQCPEYLQLISENPSLDLGEEQFPNKPDNLVWSDIWSLGIIILELFKKRQVEQYYGLQLPKLEKQLNASNWQNSSQAVGEALMRLLIKRESPFTILKDFEKKIEQGMISQRSKILQSIVEFNQQSSQFQLQGRFVPPVNQQVILCSRKDFMILAGLNVEEPVREVLPPITLAQSIILPPQQQSPPTSQPLRINIDQSILSPLLESLQDLLSEISGSNQRLADFLQNLNYQTDSIPSLMIIKQLTLKEIKSFKEKLKQMLSFHQAREVRIPQQSQKVNDIKKCQGFIFLAKCREGALLTLEKKVRFPENELIYFMNRNELLYLKEESQNLDLKKIEEYLELQSKIETNECHEINNFELLTIDELRKLKSDDPILTQEIQFCIQRKQISQTSLGIEQFDFLEKLYFRQKCDKFIQTGDDKFQLSRDQLKILNINIQEEYKLKLLEKAQNAIDKEEYLTNIWLLHDDLQHSIEVQRRWLQRVVSQQLAMFFNFIYKPNFQVEPGLSKLKKRDFPMVALDKIKDYAGQQFAQVPHGLGVKLQGKIEIYYGYFCLGVICYGQSYWQNKDKNFVVYTGPFKDGKKHGDGTLETFKQQGQEFEKLSQYKGNFIEDKMEGMGYLQDFQKNLGFEGQFLNNLLHGEVTVREGQESKQCQFLVGKLVQPGREGQQQNGQSSTCVIM